VRLVTRSDFDGVVCGAILQELELVDEILYVHPKDLQDNGIEVTENDIIANAPYAEGCGMWFDHHSSEQERLNLKGKFKGASQLLPSAAQVVYEYYIENQAYTDKLKKFSSLVKITGIVDSAQFKKDDILNPQGWILLAFIADPRTGLGYKRTFRISNLQLMKRLPGLLRSKTAEEILALSDFKERVQVYREETSKYTKLLAQHTRTEGDAIVIDFRGIKEIPVGNRFIEYVLYPRQNISLRIFDAKIEELAMIAIGHSILNRTSTVDVGSLALKYGGGGHRQVGSCQVKHDDVDKTISEMLQVINGETET
jgi:oligoribonuclease NrnB/cAMP/cGMP phosphodiesterase (DHH superfamily)